MRASLDRLRAARREQDGFTLIELLIVIVILGVLAAIVVFSVRGITNRGNVAACQSDVKTVAVAVEAHYAQNNAYAADIAELVSEGYLRSAPTSVAYTVTAGTPPTAAVVGAPSSNCAGFAG